MSAGVAVGMLGEELLEDDLVGVRVLQPDDDLRVAWKRAKAAVVLRAVRSVTGLSALKDGRITTGGAI